jgi:L-aminopeptidase/D-esterase-like protein
MRPGIRNSIADIAGILVGNADDAGLKSGVTVALCERPFTAAVHVAGGAPGTRETDLLAPENTVEAVDALVLSGGSAFGLDAAAGAQAWLASQGRGFAVAGRTVPIVPSAILFDLANGGNKDWGKFPPYRDLGWQAALSAQRDFSLGTAGAGTGATTAGLKGGLGSASAILPSGTAVGALVAVNALGSTTVGGTRHFWAAPFELGDEFGGLGLPAPLPAGATRVVTKLGAAEARANTTIAIVATDAALTKAQAKRLAIAAHDGLARAIWPAHTPLDGDLVFALATGRRPAPASPDEWIDLCAAAASTLTRAIARGVYLAKAAKGDLLPTWQSRHGGGQAARG